MLPERYRYIVVEGPIGVGKTSLARLLSQHFSGRALLETPDANPFLPRFYQDMPRYALQTQLFFLFNRVNQLQGLAQMDMFDKLTFADFILEKDPLFARLTLSDDEFRLYHEIYRQVKPQALQPDLVVYLQAPVESLVERVRRRGNAYEQNIPEEYLARITESYSRFFHEYNDAPLLIVNSENLNFVDNPADFELLLQRMAGMRGGREFFSLGN
ncbi:MAG TPA: deoxynucleoside kinase [Burkholderiales bacterium]|nr:deoxynucleoside kinase [Burkholderiales bacterium]